jgi:hypothetical protein
MMDDKCRDGLLAAGIAVVVRFLVEYSVHMYMPATLTGNPLHYVAGLSVLAMIVGSRVNVPGLGKGLFWGGILSFVSVYYNNWASLDDSCRFWTLLLCFGALVFIALHKAGKLRMGNKAVAKKGRR